MNPSITRQTSAPNSAMNILGLGVACIYIFLAFSRILDVSLVQLALLKLPLIIISVLSLLGIFSGAILRAIRTKVGIAIVIFVGWVCVTVLFSSWKGDSLGYAMELVRACLLALCLIGLGTRTENVLTLVKALAFSLLIAALLSFPYGKDYYGRIALAGGTYADPNLYGVSLVVGMPLWLLLAKRSRNVFSRMFCYLALIPMVYALLRTGSRGAALGMLMVVLFLIWYATPLQKLVIVVSVIVVLVSATVLLPDYLKKRYFTLFSVESANPGTLVERERIEADVGSSFARRQLLLDSIHLTFENPLFGVGPGQFLMQNWQTAKGEGRSAGSSVSHNTYTEISSETGIPGLILFLVVLISAYRGLSSVLKLRKDPRYNLPHQIVEVLLHLRIALIAITASAFFLSIGYNSLVYTIAAITSALAYLTQISQAEWIIKRNVPGTVSAPGPSTPANSFQTMNLPAAPSARADRVPSWQKSILHKGTRDLPR